MFSSLVASLLNFLMEVAQVPVSKLGEIFKISFEPLKSANFTFDRSFFIKVNFGAFLPTFGNFPMVFTGFPFNVILVIMLVFDLRYQS